MSKWWLLGVALTISCDSGSPPPATTPAPSSAKDPEPEPAPVAKSGAAKITVSFPAAVEAEAVDGRVIVILTPKADPEPRFQVSAKVEAAQVFGVDLDGVAPDVPIIVGSETFGFPKPSLSEVPAGRYTVQAVLHRYETFTLSNGKTVKLPMDRGEGQHWNRAPGNLYSKPVTVDFDPVVGITEALVLDQVIPAIEPPQDTKYVKHIRFQSAKLTEFWGRPMFLGAHILLPEGFDEHPEARYPLAIFHGHFNHDFGGFRPEPPDPDLKPEFSERFGVDGYNKIVQQEAHDFYRKWTGPDFPRMLIVDVQHANPYYDDSYAVNSANLGPYGDAITHELIPHLEKTYRGLGEGWARFVYGGSTGGWEALAVQVLYPDEYNGAFVACPDPIDFRAYTQVNIYEDDNAYFVQGPFKRAERPGHRNWLGHVDLTLREYNHLELVLGTNSRSGDQWDIWQAVYSPMGDDGYPKPIWDKRSGVIDHEVAEYWRDNYDLRHIMERDWATLGPKLQGKLHIYVGDMDNYYLNNAVYLTEDFLKETTQPPYGGEITYGDRAEHCWNGDPENGNHLSRLRYNTMYVPKMLERIKVSAPAGADVSSWRY